MSLPLPRFSLWAWSSKEKETSLPNGSSSSTDVLQFPSPNGRKKKKIASSSREARQKWRTQEQRIDKEFDVVLVPADGVYLSESDSDDSDWSIGWLEPHGPNFHSDDEAEEEEAENSFAVLVPCYRPKSKEMSKDPNLHFLTVFEKLQQHVFSSESNGDSYIEQWLSSLQNY